MFFMVRLSWCEYYFLNILQLFLQKAGFLYVEEAFARSEPVFRRRVVLLVSYSNINLSI